MIGGVLRAPDDAAIAADVRAQVAPPLRQVHPVPDLMRASAASSPANERPRAGYPGSQRVSA